MTKKKNPYAGKSFLGKIWYFIWNDNSIWSWIVNIILAYVIIRFLLYPGLGAVLGTGFPIVAVVSGSMEHGGDFNVWWNYQRDFYTSVDISKPDFLNYPLKNGFNKGDLIVLKGEAPKDLKIGEVIVFQHPTKSEPIIHRIVKVHFEGGEYIYQTKGDHNPASAEYEKRISQDIVLGKGVFRVPFLGWVKIGFVELLKMIGIM